MEMLQRFYVKMKYLNSPNFRESYMRLQHTLDSLQTPGSEYFRRYQLDWYPVVSHSRLLLGCSRVRGCARLIVLYSNKTIEHDTVTKASLPSKVHSPSMVNKPKRNETVERQAGVELCYVAIRCSHQDFSDPLNELLIE